MYLTDQARDMHVKQRYRCNVWDGDANSQRSWLNANHVLVSRLVTFIAVRSFLSTSSGASATKTLSSQQTTKSVNIKRRPIQRYLGLTARARPQQHMVIFPQLHAVRTLRQQDAWLSPCTA